MEVPHRTGCVREQRRNPSEEAGAVIVSTLVVGIALAAVGYVNYSIVTPQLKSMVVDICIWPLFAMGILCFIMLKAYPLHGEFNTKDACGAEGAPGK